MRKIVSFFYGILLGAGLGVALVSLLSPVSGQTFRRNLRQHYAQAMQAARDAAQAKRSELEAELNRLGAEDDQDSGDNRRALA